MRIFGKRQQTEVPDMTLVQMQESKKYDFFSALAKALLLFLLIYGALGGFLSALEMEYNKGLCMLILFILALFLSAVYETGKRWLSNIASIFYFLLYLYMAVAGYRLINGGFFVIINRLYEIARQYLNVADGMEYVLNADETYMMVTMFALFLGMVGTILLNIMLQTKCSLFKVVCLTLPPYIIPFYFDCSPDLIYILFLLAGYLTVAILQGGNVREKLSKQMRYALPLTVVVTVLIVRTVAFILPETVYTRVVPKNAVKESSEEEMIQFAQYGVMALFRRASIGAGISGGRLSKGAALMPTYETVLKVRYTPYDYQTVYLKAFTGKSYRGDRWTQADLSAEDDNIMLYNMRSRMESYKSGNAWQSKGIMEVERMSADDPYEYQPYYTDVAATKRQRNISSYTYYPAVSQVGVTTGGADKAYLDVPLSCWTAVANTCEEADFSGSEEEIAAQIVNFFQNNYAYTLRPGFYTGNPDYITHFLTESKRGYCAHFASAATMLFRYMGIPARYVEGYAFSYQDVVEGAALVEDAEYSDYYDGYAPLGETALVEIEIPDSYAHAWVEIYVENKGWIVVDPTPAQTSQEDNASFWEAFMNRNGNDTDLNIPESNLGAYLESALGGMSYVLLGAAVLFFVGFVTVYLRRAYREKRLPSRERVQLEYGRILSYLAKYHPNYPRLRTLQEQIDWIRRHSRLELSEEQAEALYQVYFAENVNYDCEELFRHLHKIRKTLKLR